MPLTQLVGKTLLLSSLLLQAVPRANAHYGFPVLIVDGLASKRWEYIRPATSFNPNYDYSGPDSICGFNGTKPLFPVKTMKVEAGSTISVGVAPYTGSDESQNTGNWNTSDRYAFIIHDGPAVAYLSKAPGELNDYEGDGDWFKIAAVGAADGVNWDIRYNTHQTQMNFTIPKTTPPGKYLLRVEHLFIQTYYKGTQMYINCAHLDISGPGGGNPSPTTKFPAFTADDSPGIWLPNAYNRPYKPLDALKNWQGAGPAVWRG